MHNKAIFILIITFCSISFYAQNGPIRFNFGVAYGLGSEFKNKNYTYTNQHLKFQVYYKIKDTKNFKYEFVLQPELNLAKHQLLNLYFVKPDEPDYLTKREKYTKLKNIKEYILNVGFLVRKPIFKSASIYVLGSIGPMITDTKTERLSKGFAFADVLAIGFTFKVNSVTFDIRPNIRHISNAGLQKTNSGYNTQNIDFGFLFLL